jgi:hypothetical protein
MKKIFYLFSKSLLSKLALAALLFVGSSSAAMGDTVIVDGNTIADGWKNGGAPGKSCSQNSTNGVTFFTTTEGQLTAQGNYSWHSINSNNKIEITTGQTIVLKLKGRSSSAKYEFSYSADNSTFSNVKNSIGLTNDFEEYVIENIEGTFYLYFWTYGIDIQSIIIKDATTPVLSVSPTTADFGSLATGDTKTYTVSNTGAGTIDVTISNSNPTDFTISKTSMNNISGGSSETFTISFNYDPESLGEKSATITVTPTYDENAAIQILATATALSDNDPKLTVIPAEDVNLGTVYSGSTTYTVTNSGTGSMTVNIASDNNDFTVSPTTVEGLGHGESETFTVTYTFAGTAEKLGLNTANITVTPTYEGGEAKTYQVSATSNTTMTLDEDNPTTVNYGSKAYLHVKYEPSAGWNTISMPFVLKNNTMNNMDKIFGEGWKAYALSSYNDGVLTFSKVSSSSTIDNGKPYLVYIAEKPTHPNGVLLNDISTTGNNPSSTSNNGATFKGTYVTKTYNEATDVETPWYGVTPSGKVMKAGAGANIKGYRAYFTGISAPSTPDARISIVFEDDGETTDLDFVKMVDPEATDVYTLSGQKVKKGSKGIYIVNGRKVVIK